MDAPYIHLLVNHFPIVLTVVGALAAVLALLTAHRTTWTFALGCLLLAGLAVYPAFLTGERAGDVMRDAWFVGDGAIREHAAAARWALWIVLGTALVAFAAMWRERTAYTGGRTILASPRWLRALVALLGLVSAAALGRTAWMAGFVVHKAERLRQAPVGAPAVGTPPPVPPTVPTPSGTTTGTAPAPSDTGLIRPPSP
jgi:hypothetical protein